MVVVGADVHKRTHTFVGVDEAARELGHRTFPATTDGHRSAVRWARKTFGAELRWAVEDCRHLSARLERDLLTDGQAVVRVPPKMMAVLFLGSAGSHARAASPTRSTRPRSPGPRCVNLTCRSPPTTTPHGS